MTLKIQMEYLNKQYKFTKDSLMAFKNQFENVV